MALSPQSDPARFRCLLLPEPLNVDREGRAPAALTHRGSTPTDITKRAIQAVISCNSPQFAEIVSTVSGKPVLVLVPLS